MKRIHVVGTSGAGKTTFAKTLAEKLGYPHIELDALYHLPNWQEATTEDFRRDVQTAIAAEKWVADGNYSKAKDLILSRADTVIFLDYSLSLILWRLTERIMRRPMLWNGNRERIWVHFFSRDSLYLWVFRTYRKRKEEFHQGASDLGNSGIDWIQFSKPSEASKWLAKVG